MKMEFEFDDSEKFTLVYENIIKAKDLMPITRALALDLSNAGYISVGDFLRDMNDNDLVNLLDISENEERDEYSQILLISEMLATGEGLSPSDNSEEFANRMSQLIMLLAVESLHRKGLVKVYRENMSFGADMADKVIVEKI
jgi:hypothetical protein